MQNLMIMFISCLSDNVYEILLKLFNLIVARFCFGKLAKIPENASALQGFLEYFMLVDDNLKMKRR